MQTGYVSVEQAAKEFLESILNTYKEVTPEWDYGRLCDRNVHTGICRYIEVSTIPLAVRLEILRILGNNGIHRDRFLCEPPRTYLDRHIVCLGLRGYVESIQPRIEVLKNIIASL